MMPSAESQVALVLESEYAEYRAESRHLCLCTVTNLLLVFVPCSYGQACLAFLHKATFNMPWLHRGALHRQD